MIRGLTSRARRRVLRTSILPVCALYRIGLFSINSDGRSCRPRSDKTQAIVRMPPIKG